jgi:hypothetical protein
VTRRTGGPSRGVGRALDLCTTNCNIRSSAAQLTLANPGSH